MSVDLARLEREFEAMGYETGIGVSPWPDVESLVIADGNRLVAEVGRDGRTRVLRGGIDPDWRALAIIARALGAEPVAPPAPDAATRELIEREVDEQIRVDPYYGDLAVRSATVDAITDRVLSALAGRLLPLETRRVYAEPGGDADDAMDAAERSLREWRETIVASGVENSAEGARWYVDVAAPRLLPPGAVAVQAEDVAAGIASLSTVMDVYGSTRSADMGHERAVNTMMDRLRAALEAR